MALIVSTLTINVKAEETPADTTVKEQVDSAGVDNGTDKQDSIEDDELSTKCGNQGSNATEDSENVLTGLWILAGVSLVIAIVSLCMHFTMDVEPKWDKIKDRPHGLRNYTKKFPQWEQIINSIKTSNYVDASSNTSKPSNSADILALKAEILALTKRIEELETKKQVNVELVEAPKPQSPAPSSPVSQKKQDNRKRLYACQNANDRNALQEVSPTLNSYRHRFELIMNSDTEGEFIIIDNEDTKNKCLNNTNDMLCCEKRGAGKRIVSQTPGKVRVSGNVAQVIAPLIVQLG